ncbi:MAG: proteinase inhibitor [Proteobacteria bacterium]|nr:proteinase inhibitor [Pseudomonadota bacterium]
MRFVFPLLLVACGVSEQPDPEAVVAEALARCIYVNSFSDAEECKEYIGASWTEDAARTDCDAPMPGADAGTFELEASCDRSSILGECFIDEGGDEASTLVFPGVVGDSCDGLSLGCGFAGGEFVASDACDGGSTVVPSGSVFKPFEQVCVDPLPGEPAGASADGQVCTWEAISASTEEGRYYADYADCATVITQRPYYPASAEAPASSDDPRLADPEWMAEYDWVTSQVEASACVCCHTEAEAPNGEPSGWFLEAGPIWTETFDDDGMAMIAGWIDSTAFGAFDADDNNGFARDSTGMPSTDPDRMKAFFEGELSRRGLTQADFVTTAPFGGPLYDQLQFEPGACANGEGVSADGTITWSGGSARYVYVLESDASAPGVPPNLDLPFGTVWRLDVDYQADPLESGIGYGGGVAGASQRWPESGSAPELLSGQTYFLYVLADIYVPLTRCLFVAP